MSKVKMLPPADLAATAECLRTMAHPARLQIAAICMQGAFAVHEIARLCGLPPHQTCEHLRLMKGHGLLASERRGREVYYRIASPQLPLLIECVRKSCSPG